MRLQRWSTLDAPAPALLLALSLALAPASACRGPGAAPVPRGPYVLLLGTAQDAGLPQLGCEADCCRAARSDPGRRRLVASLLVVHPERAARWLVDATPDLREQLERARGHPASRHPPGPRPPLFEGVLLTHAHMGHIAGLLQFGPEAYAARALPVHASARLCEFLGGQEPWALLVRQGHLQPTPFLPGEPLALRGPDGASVPDLRVRAFAVPHRDELSDTMGFLVSGPRRTLAWLPDIDAWSRWERPLEQLLEDVDVACVDGTFFAAGEVPGRDLALVPHPFIRDTIARLRSQPAALRDKLHFVHLNHGNPAADASSAAAAAVREAGMHVACEGQMFEL